MFVERSQISWNASFRFPSALWGIVVLFQLLSGSHELWITSRVKNQRCVFVIRCFLILFYSPDTYNFESLCFGINRQLHSDMANTINTSLAILISVSLFPEIYTNTLNSCLWVFTCFAACILLLMQDWSCKYVLRPNIYLPGLEARYIEWYMIKYKVLVFWSELKQSDEEFSMSSPLTLWELKCFSLFL